MKIKKLGHCCLVIETGGVRIMTDPGSFSEGQEKETGVDIILITHEHADHLHLESLRQVVQNNPEAKIFTNSAVGKILTEAEIDLQLLEDGDEAEEQGVKISGHGSEHAEIYKNVARVMNTGFMIDEQLFYPGDALLEVPKQKVSVLALPVAGPWMAIREAVAYALKIQPKVAFPVHDGMLKIFGGNHRVPDTVLPKHNIEFRIVNAGDESEF